MEYITQTVDTNGLQHDKDDPFHSKVLESMFPQRLHYIKGWIEEYTKWSESRCSQCSAADLERLDHLTVISRLIKHVVLMTSHAFTPEHGRKTQTFSNLFFRDPFVVAFRFTNDELAHL